MTIYNYHAAVKITSDKIQLNARVVCKFSDTQCVDIDAGYVFWSTLPKDTCGPYKYALLYEGNMDKIYEAEEGGTMYSLETEEVTFALSKTGKRSSCGFHVPRTEHPMLLVLENSREARFLEKTPMATTNLDIYAYMNGILLIVEKHVRKELKRMYHDILEDKCELEGKIITQSLILVILNPEEVAYHIIGQPEYLAVAAGEVIHLIKCLRREGRDGSL